MPRQETRRPSFFAALVVDAAELVVAFLGAGADSAALGATSRTWRDRVRHHDAWGAALARVAPLKARELQRGLAAKREAGEFSSSVDWAPHVSRYMRQGPASWVSNRPQQCQAGSYGTAPARQPAPSPPASPPSTMRAVGNVLGQAAGAIAAMITWQKPRRQLLVLGLDCAGKTTLLYTLRRLLSPKPDIPTIGFSVERLELPCSTLTFYDVGTSGSARFSLLWRHSAATADGIVFVVDATDVRQLDHARQELCSHLAMAASPQRLPSLSSSSSSSSSSAGPVAPQRHLPLLVLANKQDLPGALSAEAVADRLGFSLGAALGDSDALCSDPTRHLDRAWCVQGASGKAVGDCGVVAGFDWLAAAIGPGVRLL